MAGVLGCAMRFMMLLAAIVALAMTPASSAAADGRVVSWTDGDTLRVALASGTVRVRLIGIDAPETLRSERAARQGAQLRKDAATIARLGRQAKVAAERLAPPATSVRVETDVQAYDRYGRLLAYVFLADGRMVNEEMVRQEWAMVLTVPPNVRYVDRFVRAQQDARKHGRGLWSDLVPQRIASSQLTSVSVPLDLLVGSVVSGTTAAVGLLAAGTAWRAAWFVPSFWRLLQAFSILLLSTLALLAPTAIHSGRPGAPLLLALLAAAALLIHRRPIAGLLGVFAVLIGPWGSLWPVPALREDLGAFMHGAAVDPTNVSFLLFVGATLAALGRTVFIRRRLRRPLP